MSPPLWDGLAPTWAQGRGEADQSSQKRKAHRRFPIHHVAWLVRAGRWPISKRPMFQVRWLQVPSSRLWFRAINIRHTWSTLACPHLAGKLYAGLVLAYARYTDTRRCAWECLRLVPYGKRAYPALPASCTPQATHPANKQVIPELLSTVLDPPRATPQTPGTRESKTHRSLGSHFQTLRPERSTRIPCKGSGYPFSFSQGSL